jgi:hypothetical protein
MSCGHRSHHHGGYCGCGGPRRHPVGACGCATSFHGRRHFWTRAERIGHLEGYLEALENEAQAVKEQIAEMTGEG